MDKKENILSDYINDLNAERDPQKRLADIDDAEMSKMLATAKLVRTLREPELPESGYPQRLAQTE